MCRETLGTSKLLGHFDMHGVTIVGRVGMGRCPGKSRQMQERTTASLPGMLNAIHAQCKQKSPAKKHTTSFGQLQVIHTTFADPEIVVIRAAELHRSPPIAASMLSVTYHTLSPLTLWEA